MTALKVAKKELRRFSKTYRDRKSLNSYALISDKGEITRRFRSEACFSAIRGSYYIGTQYIASASRDLGKLPYEDCKHFLKWLLCESGASSMFVNKNPEYAWRVGVVVDCDAPNQAVGWGLTMHRSIWEHSTRVRLFNKLYADGVRGEVCALVMSCAGLSTGSSVFVTGYGIGHGPFGSGTDIGAYKRMTRKVKRNCLGLKNTTSFKEKGEYSNYHYLFDGVWGSAYGFINKRVEESLIEGIFGTYEVKTYDSILKAARELQEFIDEKQ